MSRSVWGPPTWILFHTLAEKIKEEEFIKHKKQLFLNIKNVCNNLPCPECRFHATSFMDKINIDKCPNKTEFKKMLFSFHNEVNARKRYTIQDISVLDKYNEPPIQELINIIYAIYTKNPGNNQLIDAFHRQKCIYNLNKWYNENKNIFT